ncbi:MAG: O-antigen ligase family protein [bacterium]|nr:O-antigen ligase family protein [bacterium]
MTPRALDQLFLGGVLLAVFLYPAGYTAWAMPVLLAAMILDIASGRRPWIPTAFDRPLVALMVALLASGLASEWRLWSAGLVVLFGLTVWISVYSVARVAAARQEVIRYLVAAWAAGGLLAAVWGILRSAPYWPIGASTPLLLPTALGTTLAATAVLVLGIWTVAEGVPVRILAAAGLVVVLTALELTWSRGAWIAALAALAALAVMVILAPRRRAGLLVLFLVTLILATAAIGPGRVSLVRRIEAVPSATFNLDRLALWEGALRIARAHPVLGTGYGTFHRAWPRHMPEDIVGDPTTAHNLYLNFAAETGLVGLAAFLAFIVAALGGLWRRIACTRGDPRTDGLWAACLAAVVAILVHQLFDVTVASVHMGFGFAALLALGQARGRR